MELDRSKSPLEQPTKIQVILTRLGGAGAVLMRRQNKSKPTQWIDSVLTADEADDLATMLMYYAQEARNGNA